jgi:electron transfer flavoprotein beta subunit
MSVVVAYKYAANPQDAAVTSNGTVDWSRAKFTVSEYDPVAIQLGKRVATAEGVKLVGVSVGTGVAGSAIAKKNAMSKGFDRGVIVADDSTAEWNPTQIAEALANLILTVGDASLVLMGDSSVDLGNRMMSALVAGGLGWPCFQEVSDISREGNAWLITQQVSGGSRTLTVPGPVVIGVSSDAVPVKVPSMKEILAAGKKPVEIVSLDSLQATPLATETTSWKRPEVRARKHVKFHGEEAATQLVDALRADGIL